jgi:hypothetical protein
MVVKLPAAMTDLGDVRHDPSIDGSASCHLL